MAINTDGVSIFGFNGIRYDDRIKTFAKWPVTFLPAEQMADSGFYYLGRGDNVRCAFCGVEISYWVERDDPTKEHQIWSPNCHFLNRFTGLESVDNKKSILLKRDVDCEDEHVWMNSLSKTDNWKHKMREKQMDLPYYGLRPLKPAFDIDFRRFSERLKTFEGWPVSFLSAEQMAGSGFYYVGREDEVSCVFCKLGLKKWEKEDDPTKEHQRWSPYCPFVRRLTESDNVNCKNSLSPEIIIRSGDYYRFAQKYKDSLTTERNKYDCPVPLDALLNLPGAAHPCYKSEDSRLRSFQDSPCIRQSPENLAAAGFFYVGPDDETKCYYCDGGLKDWEPDDVPWEQHARWFGNCAYVKLVKGLDYIQRAMTKGYSMLAPTVKRKDVDRRTFTESLEDPDFKLCLICNKEIGDVCFIPCGHIVACSNCSLLIDNCLICRRKVHKFLPIALL